MKSLQSRPSWPARHLSTSSVRLTASHPIVRIENGTFFRRYPGLDNQDGTSNPAMFPAFTFSIPSVDIKTERWAVIGPSNSGKTTLLEIFRGQHICIPPTARSFPYLSSSKNLPRRDPGRALRYVGFDSQSGGRSLIKGAYLSSRYESYKQDTDFSVLDYLKGNTTLNPLENAKMESKKIEKENTEQIMRDLKLDALSHLPVGNLSNGQKRRAEIAKALLDNPDVLLIDEPFMGLDPSNMMSLSRLLYRISLSTLQIILALRPQDFLPDWITHLIVLDSCLRVLRQGRKETVLDGLAPIKSRSDILVLSQLNGDGITRTDEISNDIVNESEPLVEMESIQIKYGEKQILGGWKASDKEKSGLWWTIRRGERWGVFGPNGSGKTTLISLICSDHPQSYSLPIKIFGRDRLPRPGQPGVSIFDIQSRIGHSSPEVHAFFPRNLTLRQTIRNAWADTFLSVARLNREEEMQVETCLLWFEAELRPSTTFNGLHHRTALSCSSKTTDWADVLRFGDLSFSAQRVALFLRAIVKKPELVVLDEAFSGMDDFVREKCMLFLAFGQTCFINHPADTRKRGENGSRNINFARSKASDSTLIHGLAENQALVCVSHLKEEVPDVVRQWICLPDGDEGTPARFGCFSGPLKDCDNGWKEVWGDSLPANLS